MSRLQRLRRIVTLIVLIACVGGCEHTRVVLIPPGEPVQLAESVRAYVYVSVNGKRIKSSERVELPEGWWCLPDTGETE